MPETKTIRPLYFVASYPHSGGAWVRSVIYLLLQLSRPDAPTQIDMRNIDNIIPWDSHGLLYRAVTGKDAEGLDELEVAEARPKVHHLLATENISMPIIRTQSIRGTFHGHETINPKVTAGGTYVVRNPLNICAALVGETGLKPLQIIELMMKVDRRVRPAEHAVTEPQGSWSQNVASWTASGQKEILVLRYEDLIGDPIKQFRRLADHMHIPATSEVLEKANGLMDKIRKSEGRPETLGDYRETLQPAMARAIIEAHAIEMDRHGYLTEPVLTHAGIDRTTALALGQRHAPRVSV